MNLNVSRMGTSTNLPFSRKCITGSRFKSVSSCRFWEYNFAPLPPTAPQKIIVIVIIIKTSWHVAKIQHVLYNVIMICKKKKKQKERKMRYLKKGALFSQLRIFPFSICKWNKTNLQFHSVIQEIFEKNGTESYITFRDGFRLVLNIRLKVQSLSWWC